MTPYGANIDLEWPFIGLFSDFTVGEAICLDTTAEQKKRFKSLVSLLWRDINARLLLIMIAPYARFGIVRALDPIVTLSKA